MWQARLDRVLLMLGVVRASRFALLSRRYDVGRAQLQGLRLACADQSKLDAVSWQVADYAFLDDEAVYPHDPLKKESEPVTLVM